MCVESPEKKLNKEIEKRLKIHKIRARKEVKLLLLGTGESGKSTFMKQMKIIHDGGFSTKELEGQRKFVFHNTIVCMQRILTEMQHLGIPLQSSQNKAHSERLFCLTITYENVAQVFSGDHLPAEYVTCIENLWKDKGVQQCYERRNEYKLSDSAGYFFNNVSRFGVVNYLPTKDDMVRIRLPTTGITEYCFQVKKIWLRIVDVGGQQSERRKWIHCFDCVKSIIFLTALNEYDMYFEHEHQLNYGRTRMQESLDLFKVISQIEVLANASFILFLNKKDLFEEKISRSPLKQFFPEYDGPNESKAAGDFISELFVKHAFGGEDNMISLHLENSLNKNSNNYNHNNSSRRTNSSIDSVVNGNRLHHRSSILSRRQSNTMCVYTHFTCATETENIKFVFESVKLTILRANIIDIFPDTLL